MVAVCVIAVAAFYIFKGTPSAGNNKSKFISADVDTGDVAQIVSATGTLNPVTVVNVGTRVSGLISKINVDFNSKVKQGDVLAEIDKAELETQVKQTQSAVEQAKANLDLAKADYKRNQELFKQKYIAEADMQKAEATLKTSEAAYKNAQAELEKSKINLDYAVITSPVSGVVTSRAVDVGQTVAASFQTPTLFKIAEDLSKMQIIVSLSEADVGQVKEGLDATFTVDAYPDRQFTGTVNQVRLEPTNVQNVVTYSVVVDVDNKDLVLLPGMTAFVKVTTQSAKDVLRVPNAALQFKLASDKPEEKKIGKKPEGQKKPAEGSNRTIYVLDNNDAKPVKIKIGIKGNKFTEVAEGELKAGDKVVIDQLDQTTGKSGSSGSQQRMMRPPF